MNPVRDPGNQPFRRGGFGTVVTVNIQLLVASACGLGSWAIWPTKPEWWGLGVISIMLGMAAVGGLANAVKAIVESYRRERVIADYMAQGAAPKSARLATTEQLRKAGMVE
jgi:hypothetical protein